MVLFLVDKWLKAKMKVRNCRLMQTKTSSLPLNKSDVFMSFLFFSHINKSMILQNLIPHVSVGADYMGKSGLVILITHALLFYFHSKIHVGLVNVYALSFFRHHSYFIIFFLTVLKARNNKKKILIFKTVTNVFYLFFQLFICIA